MNDIITFLNNNITDIKIISGGFLLITKEKSIIEFNSITGKFTYLKE